MSTGPWGATALFEPLVARDSAFARTVDAVIDTGYGRGIGLAMWYPAFGVMLIRVGGFSFKLLRRFDTEVESLWDDLIAPGRSRRRAPLCRAWSRGVDT